MTQTSVCLSAKTYYVSKAADLDLMSAKQWFKDIRSDLTFCVAYMMQHIFSIFSYKIVDTWMKDAALAIL
jgi:hypothetical protein